MDRFAPSANFEAKKSLYPSASRRAFSASKNAKELGASACIFGSSTKYFTRGWMLAMTSSIFPELGFRHAGVDAHLLQ